MLKMITLVTAASFVMLSAAAAADLPRRQPPPVRPGRQGADRQVPDRQGSARRQVSGQVSDPGRDQGLKRDDVPKGRSCQSFPLAGAPRGIVRAAPGFRSHSAGTGLGERTMQHRSMRRGGFGLLVGLCAASISAALGVQAAGAQETRLANSAAPPNRSRAVSTTWISVRARRRAMAMPSCGLGGPISARSTSRGCIRPPTASFLTFSDTSCRSRPRPARATAISTSNTSPPAIAFT